MRYYARSAGRSTSPLSRDVLLGSPNVVQCPWVTKWIWRLHAAHERLEPSFRVLARQHDSVVAGDAAEANVGANPHHGPVEPSARVRLAQANHVADPKIKWHEDSLRRA